MSEDLDRIDDFRGTPRFSVQEQLGAGAFGVVYRVFDRDRSATVALKKLRQFDAAQLARFKREFRSLVDIVHPNLVQLYELFGDDRCWFFTMELVDGVTFHSYVRPGNVQTHWDRLRDALYQLTVGVQALHSSARLHRDLKPSNVLVSNEGRVVILDFGLVKELELQSFEQTFTLVGSPAYMAPEQADSGPITGAVDWYAVGVMLFQAITGQLPFNGTWNQMLQRKQSDDFPLIGDLAPDVPDDLNEICRQLLVCRPDLRANGTIILDTLQHRRSTAVRATQGDFVGRSTELAVLQSCFSSLSSGSRRVVLLQGPSGIGKTAVVGQFLSDLREKHPEAVILRGRCRQSELVPYKALDPIVDELVQYLRSLPAASAATFLPRQPALLRRLFPVFGQLDALSAFADRTAPNVEEQEIRNRAFAALRELLGRMTDRTMVVISIDDLQWGDLDSIAFLAELLLPVNAPVLMLLLSFRQEDADSSPPLLLLRSFRERLKDPESWTDIELSGLSEDDSRDLLQRLGKDGKPITEAQSKDILRESRGSPLLMSELLRFASREMEADERSNPPTGVLISEMICHRAGNLSSTGRRMLEALSVAAEPVSKAMLYRAVKIADEDPARETELLIREHLVRVTGGSQEIKFEPFHDQVREASLASLSPQELRNWHSHLAELLEAEADTNPQRLLRHYRGAGNLPGTFDAALAAAKTAEAALAFEQAARFYEEALETGEANDAAKASLHRKRAEALAKAGLAFEAGRCYLEAARWPAHNDAIDMRRLGAEQLMRSGHLDQGTQILADLLRGAGVDMPIKPLETVLRMLILRAAIRLRGLRWRERSEADIPSDKLRRLDLLWSGALILAAGNPIFGNYLQARHMLDALRLGEPRRLGLSLGLGAFYESLGGLREYKRGRQLLDLALRLAERLNDHYLFAITYANWATVDFECGRIEDGLLQCQAAFAALEKSSGDARAWERSTLDMLLIWFLGWGGRIRQLSEKLPLVLEEGRSRGNVYAHVAVRCFTTAHLVDLAADDPEGAIAETTKAIKQWRKTRYDLQHFGATYACMECHLYSGRTEEARQILLADWQAIRRSLLFRKAQTQRVILFYARGRTALAEWLRRRDARELRAETEQYSERLAKLRSPWSIALSMLLRAGILAGHQRRDEAALILAKAEEMLRQQDLRLLAAAALRRRGELEGRAGADRIDMADAFMKSEGVLRPDRMTTMILPGDWQPKE